MIGPRWRGLEAQDRDIFQVTVAFLDGRIAEPQTLEWAINLAQNETARRAAVLEAVDRACEADLAEPLRASWRLIEEAWGEAARQHNDQHMTAVYISERLKQGDYSGTIIEEIVGLVRPRLQVSSAVDLSKRRRHWQPRRVSDVLYPNLASGELLTPAQVGLNGVKDARFLYELARKLDDAVQGGLQAARRFGWDGRTPYRLGLPERIALTPLSDDIGRDDVDQHREGLAPAVKLLHAVLRQGADLDPAPARVFARRYSEGPALVETRLWASLALDPTLVSYVEVSKFLRETPGDLLWSIHSAPEILQLLAVRFSEFTPKDQQALLKRLMRGPPLSNWPRDAEAARRDQARRYWIVRELRRIAVAGAALPADKAEWMEAQLEEFPDLARSTRIDEGFPGRFEAYDFPAPGDDGYDLVVGKERLDRLERALRTTRVGWGDDPADRAVSWIGEPRNALAIIADFESLPAGERNYPEIWDRFGWRHHPAGDSGSQRDLSDEARRVIDLVEDLSPSTLESAVDGLSDWLSHWSNQAVQHPSFPALWKRLWPYAIAKTNAQQPPDEEPRLDVIVHGAENAEPRDLDTYNTPAGKMVGAFLALCPHLNEVQTAFPEGAPQTELRDLVIAEAGRAGLVAKHRLSEHLSYFVRADEVWTRTFLLPLLTAEDEAALALWNAVTRRGLSPGVLEYLAPYMLQRAVDPRLGRQTRRRLAFRLLIDCLHAFREHRAPWATHAALLDMIRSLDDEVRAQAAEAPQRFLRDVPEPGQAAAEALFDEAVAPFLAQVWPQERSLSTPGVARAFADLPATAGGRFAEALRAVERFLVPFDCWSLIEYGLYGADEEQRPRLEMIDDGAKAEALLTLLDRTISATQGAVIPHNLSSALQQVRNVAPYLAERPSFRRLATAARM